MASSRKKTYANYRARFAMLQHFKGAVKNRRIFLPRGSKIVATFNITDPGI